MWLITIPFYYVHITKLNLNLISNTKIAQIRGSLTIATLHDNTIKQ